MERPSTRVWKKMCAACNFVHTSLFVFGGTGLCLGGNCTPIKEMFEQLVVSATLAHFIGFVYDIDKQTAFSGMYAIDFAQNMMFCMQTIPTLMTTENMSKVFSMTQKIIGLKVCNVVVVPLLCCLPAKCQGLQCLETIVQAMPCRAKYGKPRMTALGITASFVPSLPVIVVNLVFLFVVELAQRNAKNLSTWTSTPINKIQVLLDLCERCIGKIVANQSIVAVARSFSEDNRVSMCVQFLCWCLYVTLKTVRPAEHSATHVVQSRMGVVCKWLLCWLLCFIPESFSWTASTPLMQAPEAFKTTIKGFTLETNVTMITSLTCAGVLPGSPSVSSVMKMLLM
jgi:hypothetical protein